MPYVDVQAPTGVLLFKYDHERSLVEVKCPNLGLLTIDLLKYQHAKAAPTPKQPQPDPVPTDATPAE